MGTGRISRRLSRFTVERYLLWLDTFGGKAQRTPNFYLEEKGMKKFLVFALVLMLALPLMASAATLKVGMECNYAPFNWTQSQESDTAVKLPDGSYADGYDVQVAKYIAEKLGMDLEIVKTEWDGLPPALTSGKIDAIIAGMSPTTERKLVIDFSDAYYDSDLVVVVRKDGPYANAKTLKDFAGAKITGQLNTFHYTVINQMEGVQQQTAMESFPVMTVALSSGRIDGYISERPGAISASMSNPDLTYVAFEEGEGFQHDPDFTTIAVGLQKGSPLMDKVNEALATLDDDAREKLMVDAITNQPLSE